MIWWTLGHVLKNFPHCHFHNTSKECFWTKKNSNFVHVFKSAIWEKLKNCQNGTFEPVHEIRIFFWSKAFFWSIMKMARRKNIHNLSQGPPNPGFMQKKVELKNFGCFRFRWIFRRPGKLNWERVFFWLSKNLYKQYDYLVRKGQKISDANYVHFSYFFQRSNKIVCLILY